MARDVVPIRGGSYGLRESAENSRPAS